MADLIRKNLEGKIRDQSYQMQLTIYALEFYYLFFVPILVGILFLIFIVPPTQEWFASYIPNLWYRILGMVLLFLTLTFTILRIGYYNRIDLPNR